MALNATMIRERCIIQDPSLGKQGSRILSNRLILPMAGDLLVVRGQNMHSVARYMARLYKRTPSGKSFAAVRDKVNLRDIWLQVEDDARLTNPENWISVYLNGERLFTSEAQHPFIDAIEKQVNNSESNYDLNVMLASETFEAAGHPNMTIDHSTNVALILSVTDDQARTGLIYRHPRRTTTFSFSASPSATALVDRPLIDEVPAILEASADFLESIQICYALAADGAKGIEQNFKLQDALKTRLNALRRSLDAFEEGVKVTYRPERPDMNRFLLETQQLLTKRA